MLAGQVGANPGREVLPIVNFNPAQSELELVETRGTLLAEGAARQLDHSVAEPTGNDGAPFRSGSTQELDLNGRGARIGVVHAPKDTMTRTSVGKGPAPSRSRAV
jgi:hypothetical protein